MEKIVLLNDKAVINGRVNTIQIKKVVVTLRSLCCITSHPIFLKVFAIKLQSLLVPFLMLARLCKNDSWFSITTNFRPWERS